MNLASQRLSGEFEVYQYLAAGGNWWVAEALDISDQAHAVLQLRAVTRTILVYVESTTPVCFKIDASDSDTTNTSNDEVLSASTQYLIKIPHDIAYRPYIHFKQTSSAASAKIRLVER